MSALVFLVVSLVGAVLVGELRAAHLGLGRSENRPASAIGALRSGDALRRPLPPALDAHDGRAGAALADPSAA